ncbi:GNAT family N-acetyltransferase [Frankia sp. CNm7]|uniref:GNAT family N-acetyltransferase n=1 Tax=Frankia nepalensis TaxID=1836974 RepID=A0A937RQE5_9ACTN|nr:GNAT family N-acetyltransferase [Frankia nepalensis]MBL7500496.1 GNAT family N-acetyltransferase [Frankia nepalensis]MBL7511225.1 GNAT family N-acetyltransferase [Frankia nepalensis]MBL7523365.1 GNAT family N-acetyltransferase [Frankia nepalensis]MBL7631479.1 GNAT family N-acetyltransferase [Frankia nepalensis]
MSDVRAATPADMPAVRAVATGFGLLDTWPGRADFLDLEREDGRLWVADGDEGVVGFAGTLSRGTLTHLGDLFVDPRTQSAGLGRRLLSAVLPGAGADVVTFASSDPRALTLYLRHGLRPSQPLWYLNGRPKTPPAGAVRPPPVGVDEVAGLDAEASGGHRGRHLAWYAAQPGVTAWSTRHGYAFTRVHGDACVLGPAGGRDPDACVQAVLAAVGQAADRGLAVSVAVFGAHPAVPALLDAGLRLVDQDTFMTSRDGALDVYRYVPNPDLG